MSRVVLLVLAALGLTGCISDIQRSKKEPFTWTGKCIETGCVEKVALRDAPVGSELSFTQCAGQTTQSFKYSREQRGWVLMEYKAEAAGHCAGP